MSEQLILGVDAGGTFTDFVLLRENDSGSRIQVHKVVSTPDAPEQAILQGIRELDLEGEVKSGKLQIIHGSTVATNAALEGKGVPTAFITNRGFADLLTLGRQTRPALYRLEFPPVKPPVNPDYCIEVGGRLSADGEVLEPLTDSDLDKVCSIIMQLKPRAIAINLLFSFIDDSFERTIQAALEKLGLPIFVSRSSEVLPEYKEYERGIATWLNASLGPIVNGYLNRLSEQLGDCPLMIMQSSGETITATVAAGRAVNLLLSGPAAGLGAISHLGRQTNQTRFISFDMGGTSTDVALLDGELKITNEGRIASYPVAVPMVDMHTIGAGGGSIAFLDAGGMLQVGPQSAGAEPGPACYGNGGQAVTVTDANLILGRIQPEFSLAGSFKLNLPAALQAMAPLASTAGLTLEEAALGIIEVANEHMASALRMISVQRGYNPAEFTLASFGGAGGLHVCALAELMGMSRAVVPANAGVLSALGMLVAPQGRQFSKTVRLPGDSTDEKQLQIAMQQLIRLSMAEMEAEGLDRDCLQSEPSIDMCYRGQSSTLNLPWRSKQEALLDFHKAHHERYGFSLERETEIVNLRVRITRLKPIPEIPAAEILPPCNKLHIAMVYGHTGSVSVYERQALELDQTVNGPAIIIEPCATTYIANGWLARKDRQGNLWLSRGDQGVDQTEID